MKTYEAIIRKITEHQRRYLSPTRIYISAELWNDLREEASWVIRTRGEECHPTVEGMLVYIVLNDIHHLEVT